MFCCMQEPADTHSTRKVCIRGQAEAARVQEALAVAKTKVHEACLIAPAGQVDGLEIAQNKPGSDPLSLVRRQRPLIVK
jgi:hypothetical protein